MCLTFKGQRVTGTILAYAPYLAAKRLCIYLSMPTSELSTTSIVRHALQSGKDVFVPYLYEASDRDRGADGYLPKRCMDMVKLRGLDDFEALERDSWGIPTISEDGLQARESVLGCVGTRGDGKGLDLMLLPGVAFQKRDGEEGLRRLGHGKGFYDFFLRRLKEITEAERVDGKVEGWPGLVGVVLEEQVLREEEEKLLMGEHDNMLDEVVVGDGRIL